VRKLRKHRPSGTTLVATIAVVLAAGSFAYASIPDTNGVIHGCYNNTTGALRVVDDHNPQCTGDQAETALDWNQQGRTGPVGSQGARGPQGMPGRNGHDASLHSFVAKSRAILPSNGTPVAVAALNLPRGDYMAFVSGTTGLERHFVDGAWDIVSCHLDATGNRVVRVDDLMPATVQTTTGTLHRPIWPVSAVGTFGMTTPIRLVLICRRADPVASNRELRIFVDVRMFAISG
jgi:hypothetical protein